MPREMRQMMISEFRDWLGTQTNKQHRPFQEETIEAYSSPFCQTGVTHGTNESF
jgi:hypothetical protein